MPHSGTPTLQTPRLLLRRFTVADAPAMYQGWANDPEVTRYMMWTPHQSEDETRATLEGWVAEYAKPDFYRWAIVPKAVGRPIGSIGIHHYPPKPGEPDWEPGYCIGRPWWGQGYTTEALQAVVGWFVKATGITSLGCTHAVANPASGAVMRKAGFVYVSDGSYTQPDGTEVPSHNYIYQPEAPCPKSNC